MDKDLVGKVIHYYDKIGVAVVKLSKNLKQGDKVKFGEEDGSFEQTVESMQLDYKPISEGKAKSEVAIKVSQGVKKGTPVFLA